MIVEKTKGVLAFPGNRKSYSKLAKSDAPRIQGSSFIPSRQKSLLSSPTRTFQQIHSDNGRPPHCHRPTVLVHCRYSHATSPSRERTPGKQRCKVGPPPIYIFQSRCVQRRTTVGVVCCLHSVAREWDSQDAIDSSPGRWNDSLLSLSRWQPL